MDNLISGLRAAGEPTRLRLLNLLSRAELTVSDLTLILGQSQPRVSRHLKLLTEAGLVARFREGTWVFYRLAATPQTGRISGVEDNKGILGPPALAETLIDLIPQNDITVLRDLDRLEAVKQKRAAVAAAYFAENAEEWGRIRSLYIPEAEVEIGILKLLGDETFGTLLDIGTGTGRILDVLSDRYEEGIGIDLSHEMLGVARANIEKAGLANAYVRFGDLYALPFENDSVDLVTIHHVLHFLEDPLVALAEAARVLRPGGKLLIVDFAPHEVEFLRDEHAHRRLGFSDEEVAGWLQDCGLTTGAVRHLVRDKNSQDTEEVLTVTLWLGQQKTDVLSNRPLEITT